MKQVFTAKSIDEAKAMAAAEFGVEESKIAFNVIEEPKKGLFGKLKGDRAIFSHVLSDKACYFFGIHGITCRVPQLHAL